MRDAGFQVQVIPNQGKGAAMMRIEAVRRLLPQVWFNKETTEAGREALGYYHERKNPSGDFGMGPAHDWSSHFADAFRYLAVGQGQYKTNSSTELRRKPKVKTTKYG